MVVGSKKFLIYVKCLTHIFNFTLNSARQRSKKPCIFKIKKKLSALFSDVYSCSRSWLMSALYSVYGECFTLEIRVERCTVKKIRSMNKLPILKIEGVNAIFKKFKSKWISLGRLKNRRCYTYMHSKQRKFCQKKWRCNWVASWN